MASENSRLNYTIPMNQPLLFEEFAPPAPPEQLGVVKITERRASTILAKGMGLLKSVDYTLNPYIGCQFACAYCYASFFVPEESKFRDWGKWVEVKVNALELLAKKRDIGGKLIVVGSATDPYQPVERQTQLTRSLIEFLSTVKPQPKLIVLTRSPDIVRDIDLFRRFEELSVHLSITTDCDEVRKRYEPSNASIPRRIEAVTELAASGVDVQVSICPMLPIRNPGQFADRLKATGARHFWAGEFHDSTRAFASGTRDLAKELAAEDRWDKAAVRRTVAEMRQALPNLRFSEGK
jgi:DNA repair photolyase